MKQAYRFGGRLGAIVLVLMLVALGVFVACGNEGFDPGSKVDSVRLFVVAADKPYAKPGDTITLTALYTDARAIKPRPTKLFWLPILCLNPPNDLYYLCFANAGDASNQAGSTRIIPLGPLAALGSADGGADAGSNGQNPFTNIPTGIDLSPYLAQGATFSFTMPTDAIIPRNGTDAYGLAIMFNVLCAGRIEFAKRDPGGSPQQVPILCTDENDVPLPATDYVIGISRVYAYADRTNANPTIQKLTFMGNDVDGDAGITYDTCTTTKQKDCPDNKIDMVVSDDSWELNPADVTNGNPLHEQIWVDYYSDVGAISDEARLLFDTQEGRIEDTADTIHAPRDPADGTLWAVAHDNRGGASWTTIPVHVH